MKFTAAGLTHFGGIYLLHQFLQQLRMRSYLYHHLAFPGAQQPIHVKRITACSHLSDDPRFGED